MKPFSHHLLAKATALKNESRTGFQELVRQYTRRIAPRHAVEQAALGETRSTTRRLHRPRAIGPRTIDPECRIQALRRSGEKEFAQTAPVGHTSGEPPAGPVGRAHRAPEPLSMRLRPHTPVPRTSARELKNLHLRHPKKNPRKTQEKPKKTQEKPTETRGIPAAAFPTQGLPMEYRVSRKPA
jgi:hypothetical protein